MKSWLKRCIMLVFIGSSVLLSGCFDKSEDESKLPWTKPAAWETNAPGLGGFIPY